MSLYESETMEKPIGDYDTTYLLLIVKQPAGKSETMEKPIGDYDSLFETISLLFLSLCRKQWKSR